MTPKEKATQLIQRFYFSLPNNGGFSGLNNINSRWEEGKNCALICVNEIIQSLDESLINADIEYYKQVKQEIEKL